MTMLDSALDHVGGWLARRVSQRSTTDMPFAPADLRVMVGVLKPADVILVEGQSLIATAIKYLTQSTWSHAAMYVGDALGARPGDPEGPCLVESNLGEGCVAAPLSKYDHESLRICRPSGLTDEDRVIVVNHIVGRLGIKYDTRNVIDLARYLMPTPPVPMRWRRRMIALGSGEPTRAICSTLIAQAFEEVRYPILPRIETVMRQDCTDCPTTESEILHIRHHSLYAPRDFDVSPFFDVIKPSIASGFDYRLIEWADRCERPKSPGQTAASPLMPST